MERKDKIFFFCILIGCVVINTQMAIKDIKYLLGITGSIILYFISMSRQPFHRFWNDLIPVPFLIAMWLCYAK